MFVAVIEVDSATTPHVILGRTMHAVNRRVAEILTAATWIGPQVERFVKGRPAPLDDPTALLAWLQDFHEDFTEPWVSTYVTDELHGAAVDAVDTPWVLRGASIPPAS